MDNTVTMRTLPDEVEFPADLRGKVYFDPDREKLICRGFMCKTEYDRLMRLSDDYGYQRALVTLFQNSTVTNCKRMRRFAQILAALTVAALSLVVVVWGLLLTEPYGNHSEHPAPDHTSRPLLPLATDLRVEAGNDRGDFSHGEN